MTLPNSSSINSYGSGILVDAIPMIDPTSELGAAALNPLRNDVSAMTAVVPRCIFQFHGSASTPSIYSSATWTAGMDSVWGNTLAVQPTLSRTATGIVVVTMPASVSDQIGNNILVNVRAVEVSKMGGSTPGVFSCVVNSASQFTINIYAASTAVANDFVDSIMFVKVF